MSRFLLVLVVFFMALGCSEDPKFSYIYKEGKSVSDFELMVQGRELDRVELASIFSMKWPSVVVGMQAGSVINLFGEPDIHVLTSYQVEGVKFDSVVFFYALKIFDDGRDVGEEQWVRFHFDEQDRLFWGVTKNMHLSTVGDKNLSRGMYWTYR